MNISALLTSAAINIGLCILFLSLYSILRKQPANVGVYFGRRLAEEHIIHKDSFSLERLLPSPSWIIKAWETSENEILSVAGLDAVVFLRLIVLSIRIFCVAGFFCLFLILPLNYHGQVMHHRNIPSESLDVFTIANVQKGSKRLWVHCLVLYVISFSVCLFLYFEYKKIAKLRLAHITGSSPNPSHFSVLVRAIPRISDKTFSDTVRSFFSKYHESSYLSHQMIYRTGKVQKIMNDAEKIYRKCVHLESTSIKQRCIPCRIRCSLCEFATHSSKEASEFSADKNKANFSGSEPVTSEKECGSCIVFFKTRYAAFVVSQVLQYSNPMLWVTDLAPEPDDVYWSNLWIPYKQLWFRRIATLLGAVILMFLFLIPVTFIQGLSQLDQLQQKFPFLNGILEKPFVTQLVTGYLPSVILHLFLYSIPPLMLLFTSIEGSISRSDRKKSACCKVLYFMVWNIFFVNVFSGSVIRQFNVISSPRDLPNQLAKAVPAQATLFITYVLTSGWASLSSEVMQLFSLLWNFAKRYIFRSNGDLEYIQSFPYHTEVPKVLLFGLLGLTCSILAPLILPFLLVYFLLGYVIYRNQILNVYCRKYETGGQYWPIMHAMTIFSLVLAQIIALGVFGLKDSPVASSFTIPLIILTLLFNQYCRKRFQPIFHGSVARDLIEMDQEDEKLGKMEEIHHQILTAYLQSSPFSDNSHGNESNLRIIESERGHYQPKLDNLVNPTLDRSEAIHS